MATEREDEAYDEASGSGESNVPGADERQVNQRSNVDAMGREKRRQVVGGQYGATVRKQLTVYGIFVAFVAVIGVLAVTVVSGIDNRDMPLEETAPWTEAGADQSPPRDIDFPANGPINTIPVDEIGEATPPDKSDSLLESESNPDPG